MLHLALRFVIVNCLIWSVLIGLASCGGSGGTTGSSDPGGTTGGSTGGSGSCGSDFATPNYVDANDPNDGEPNLIVKWAEFPIKVWLDAPVIFDTGSGNISSDDIVTEAINRWTTVTADGVQYTIVSDESEAQLKIRLVNVPGPPHILGRAQSTYNPSTNIVISSEITINTWDSMTLVQFRDGMKATITHEMGHSLYIFGHSDQNADIMFPSHNSSLDGPVTTRDTNTIMTAYCGDFPSRGRAYQDDGPFVTRTIECRADHR